MSPDEIAEIINTIANSKEALEAINATFYPEKDWVDYLQALLTPILAFFGIYIAIQQ